MHSSVLKPFAAEAGVRHYYEIAPYPPRNLSAHHQADGPLHRAAAIRRSRISGGMVLAHSTAEGLVLICNGLIFRCNTHRRRVSIDPSGAGSTVGLIGQCAEWEGQCQNRIRPVPNSSVEHNAPARLRVLRVPGSHKVKHAKVHRGNAHRMRRKDLKRLPENGSHCVLPA